SITPLRLSFFAPLDKVSEEPIMCYSLGKPHGQEACLLIRLVYQPPPIRQEQTMGRSHPSTPAQQAQWVSQLLAHDGLYGIVSQIARASGVSRQTLYRWKAR